MSNCRAAWPAVVLAAAVEDRAEPFSTYRSCVYNYGKGLVRKIIEPRGGTADHPERRWKEFERLLSSPRLPSGLR